MSLRMKKDNDYQLAKDTLYEFFKFMPTIGAICISCSINVNAQGISAQGIGGADLSALRNSAGFQGAGALGGTNLPGLLSITVPSGVQEDFEPQQEDKRVKRPAPLPPNEFQKYVLQITGQSLNLFGADFFENLTNNNSQFSRSPVSDDYVLGAGDQLLIRVWGSTSAEAMVTLDRQGAIAFPKLGTLRLAGVKAGQLDAVVKSYFNKFYKDIEVSVSFGKLRKITVFVVGHARNPGSYSLTSQSTLTSALFASGGPNGSGSLRGLQVLRQGKSVAEFDLYNFLGKGDKSQDIKLQDGDVVFFPKAAAYMAVIGKVNTPSIFEVKSGNDTLDYFIGLAGGLPVSADPRRATLDRIQPGAEQPRNVESVSLMGAGLQTKVKNGDVLTVATALPEIAGAVTLRGSVAQPARFPWKPGMRVSDVINKKSLLLSPDSIRKQNEVLFDKFEQERIARSRAKVPTDIAVERVLLEKQKKEEENLKAIQSGVISKVPEPATLQLGVDPAKATYQEQTEREIAIAQLGKPEIIIEKSIDTVGVLSEQINLDYAVVERYSREDFQITLLPFNLGKMLQSPNGPDDLNLESGDIITVFSSKDIQIPSSRQKAFVRIEGEVNKPGIYPVSPRDTLRSLIEKAGGTTPEAYLFATGLFREDVKKSQQRNMDRLLRKIEAESSAAIAQITQSGGASADPPVLQAKAQSAQQAQKQSLERFRILKPEGRISLSLKPSVNVSVENFPTLRLENGDRIYIPPRPDFVQVLGSVNTESALVYKTGLKVNDYIALAGVGSSADVKGALLVRADGSAMTNQSYWSNDVLNAEVLPGDTIVMPEKFDRESAWSQTIRSAKDFTQVLYQLGLGAAAIKTLRQ